MHIVEGPNPLNSERVSGKYLEINSCGYTLDEHRDLCIDRKLGRVDYELIYVSSGTITFLFDGVPAEVSKGTAVIYKPGEPQIYNYYKQLPQAAYWVHFTGTAAEELLRELALDGKYIYNTGLRDEIPRLFEKIFEEFIIRAPGFQNAGCSYLISLLNFVSRYSSRGDNIGEMKSDARLRQVVEYMRGHCDEAVNLEIFARMCCLSRSRFIHLFKEITGRAPYRYILDMRVEKSKYLLAETDLSVSEIGEAVGYSELKSFIRVFNNSVGMSPGTYRKLNLKITQVR